ncbi:MAG: type I glyceraldehyde-3-phosphate dehydrogenase [Planctomycetota bacterium]
MAIRLGINGFGRIGRLVYRIASEHPGVTVAAINDLVPPENLAYLLQHDTMHGRFRHKGEPVDVRHEGTTITAAGAAGTTTTHVFEERDPAAIQWGDHGVDVVIESTGLFTTGGDAAKHLRGGAKRVLISAPTKTPDEVPTLCYKVNHERYDPTQHTVVSNASCTTNCLAPIAKVIDDAFGLEEGLMATIHAVTATQPTQDGPSKKDLRGGRNGYMNIIPASTGAAKAVGLCLPQLKGKLTGLAYRVPTADVSCVDLTFRPAKATSLAEINAAMKAAAEGPMEGVLAYTEAPVVSSDFIGDHHSSIYDATAGIELSDRFFKVLSWYDNEAGYAARCVDMVEFMAG